MNSPAEARWIYKDVHDTMSNITAKTAVLMSSNYPQLPFPDHGGSPVTLTLARVPALTILQFRLSRGQFDCDRCQIAVKVGDKLLSLQAKGLGCGVHACLDVFADELIEKLPASKTVIAELPIYRFGRYHYRFDTDGFQWEP